MQSAMRRLLIACFMFPMVLPAQSDHVKFHHLTVDDGLSQSNVQCIFKDSQGLMWFGTEDGLNCYDGTGFTVFRHNPSDSTSISNNFINKIIEDRDGRLWMATLGGGVNVFDKRLRQFRQVVFPDPEQKNLGFLNVHTLEFDKRGKLWIGYDSGALVKYDTQTGEYKQFNTDNCDIGYDDVWDICLSQDGRGAWLAMLGGGVDYLDFASEEFIHFKHDAADRNSLADNRVWTVYQDSLGRVWAGLYGSGLDCYLPDQQRFVHYRHDPENPSSINHDVVFVIQENCDGTFWIGTEEGGLNHFNPATGCFKAYSNRPTDHFSLSHNSVESIFCDDVGTVWVGTYNGGVNYFNPLMEKFELYQKMQTPGSLSNSAVLSFLEDSRGRVWVGTDGGGLNLFNRSAGKFEALTSQDGLSHNVVLSLIEDKSGYIWAGTYAGGLNRFDPGNRTFRVYRHDDKDERTISSDDVRSLLEDSAGRLWVGTRFGLNLLDRQTGRVRRYLADPDDPRSLSHPAVYTMLEDGQGRLWVGTNGGLNRYRPTEDGFYQYLFDPDDATSISDNFINCLFEDSRGILWVGTGNGLNRYYHDANHFERISGGDGALSTVIKSIEEDIQGRLWISTNNGLYCYSPESRELQSYNASDGLQSNDFHYGTSMKAKNGLMYFGGVNGFNVFHPDSLTENKVAPDVLLTGLTVMNEDALRNRNGMSHLDEHISYADQIVLSHKATFFTIHFAALNYLHPEKNRYRYRMPPYQNEWVPLAHRSEVSFTGLSPGEYVFQVTGSNNDGIWDNSPAMLEISIIPPYWQRWWFRLLMVLAGVMLISAVFLVRVLSIQAKNRELASVNERLHHTIRERKEAEEIIRKSLSEKEVLLKEIHHRVKNNLQVISSLLNLQSRRLDDESLKGVFKESQNRIRTMALVHEKLYQSEDLSAIDFEGYISSLVKNLIQAYRVSSHKVRTQVEIEKIALNIDMAIPLGLVINELISNAFKHAFPDSFAGPGVVKVSLNRVNDDLILEVSDNGIGIPPGFDIRNATSLGLKLLVIIVEDQLDGRFEVSGDQGTRYEIICPLKK